MNVGRCFVFLFPLRHLDFFEMVRNEDDLELAKRFDLVRFSLEYLNLPKLNLHPLGMLGTPFLRFDFDAERGSLIFTVPHLSSRKFVMCEQ